MNGRVKLRGFAALSKEQRRAVATQGGKAAHEKGTAHQFTTEEARAAGRRSHQRRQESRSK